jgi:hypothetical protein
MLADIDTDPARITIELYRIGTPAAINGGAKALTGDGQTPL